MINGWQSRPVTTGEIVEIERPVYDSGKAPYGIDAYIQKVVCEKDMGCDENSISYYTIVEYGENPNYAPAFLVNFSFDERQNARHALVEAVSAFKYIIRNSMQG